MLYALVNVLTFLYSVWWWLAVALTVCSVVYAVLVARSDCDLVLAWYSRWGKNPSPALYGKIVWVTGASSGIGENLCYVLARCGAVLILSARREKELKRVLKQCCGKELECVVDTAVSCATVLQSCLLTAPRVGIWCYQWTSGKLGNIRLL